jgi:hypothetical protein
MPTQATARTSASAPTSAAAQSGWLPLFPLEQAHEEGKQTLPPQRRKREQETWCGEVNRSQSNRIKRQTTDLQAIKAITIRQKKMNSF